MKYMKYEIWHEISDEVLDEALRKLVAARVAASSAASKQLLMDAIMGMMSLCVGSTPALRFEALRALDGLLAR